MTNDYIVIPAYKASKEPGVITPIQKVLVSDVMDILHAYKHAGTTAYCLGEPPFAVRYAPLPTYRWQNKGVHIAYDWIKQAIVLVDTYDNALYLYKTDTAAGLLSSVPVEVDDTTVNMTAFELASAVIDFARNGMPKEQLDKYLGLIEQTVNDLEHTDIDTGVLTACPVNVYNILNAG